MPQRLKFALTLASKYWWLSALFLGSFTAAQHFSDMESTWVFPGNVVDLGIFGPAARSLLRGDFAAVYESPENQGAPIHLLTVGAVDQLAQLTSVRFAWLFLAVVLCISLLLAAGKIASISATKFHYAKSSRAALITVVALIATDSVSRMYEYGHWGHLFVALCVGASAALLRSSSPLRNIVFAGVLLGLATGFEPVAVIGVGIVVLAPSVRVAMVYLASAGIVSLLIWTPFLLQPAFAMTQMTWQGDPYTLWWLLGIDDLNYFVRFIQAALAIVIIGISVDFLRRLNLKVSLFGTLVAMVVALSRAMTDVQFVAYYYLIPLIVVATLIVPLVLKKDLRAVLLITLAWLPLWFSLTSVIIPRTSAWPALALVSVLLSFKMPAVYIVDGRLITERSL